MKKNFYFLFFCFILCGSAKGQNWGLDNDYESIQFTYTLQYVTSQFKVFPAADWKEPIMEGNTQVSSPLSAMRSPVTSGFAIGLGATKHLRTHTVLRLIPTLTFANRLLNYEYHDVLGTTPEGLPIYHKERKVNEYLLEFPLSMKLKSNRRGNFGVYMTGGAKYSTAILQGKRNNDTEKIAQEKMLKNSRNYFSYEAGLGLDLYFKFLTLSPEIKYSSSFNNIMKQENSVFSRPIDKLMLRNVTFSLYIQ